MSARFSRGLAVGLFLFLARAVHAELPAAPGPASEALRARCHADLERVIAEAVRFGATHRRAQALLAGLSTACEGVLPERLRDGAGRAASARRLERARHLLEAARGFVPEDCLAPADTWARGAAPRCPPPEDIHFAAPLPPSLDTGSYAFALAVRATLLARGAYDERAQRWVAEFLLRSALEGEAAPLPSVAPERAESSRPLGDLCLPSAKLLLRLRVGSPISAGEGTVKRVAPREVSVSERDERRSA